MVAERSDPKITLVKALPHLNIHGMFLSFLIGRDYLKGK
jgi:hypothetical protein